MYWRRRLTRLELAIYSAIVGVAMVAFLERALYYMEIAERTAVQTTIANVNSALAVRSARGLLGGHPVEAVLNPFDVTGVPPNYLGALTQPELETLARRVWLFDSDRNEVVYLPRHTRSLFTSESSDAIRYRQVHEGGIQKLVPTDKWHWN